MSNSKGRYNVPRISATRTSGPMEPEPGKFTDGLKMFDTYEPKPEPVKREPELLDEFLEDRKPAPPLPAMPPPRSAAKSKEKEHRGYQVDLLPPVLPTQNSRQGEIDGNGNAKSNQQLTEEASAKLAAFQEKERADKALKEKLQAQAALGEKVYTETQVGQILNWERNRIAGRLVPILLIATASGALAVWLYGWLAEAASGIPSSSPAVAEAVVSGAKETVKRVARGASKAAKVVAQSQ